MCSCIYMEIKIYGIIKLFFFFCILIVIFDDVLNKCKNCLKIDKYFFFNIIIIKIIVLSYICILEG